MKPRHARMDRPILLKWGYFGVSWRRACGRRSTPRRSGGFAPKQKKALKEAVNGPGGARWRRMASLQGFVLAFRWLQHRAASWNWSDGWSTWLGGSTGDWPVDFSTDGGLQWDVDSWESPDRETLGTYRCGLGPMRCRDDATYRPGRFLREAVGPRRGRRLGQSWVWIWIEKGIASTRIKKGERRVKI